MRKLIIYLFLVMCLFPSSASAAIGGIITPKQQAEEYELVNDHARIFTKEQNDELTKELKYLSSAQKDRTIKFRMFIFTTTQQKGGISGAEKDLFGGKKIDQSISPVVFIYDATSLRYAIVADERLETYISPKYIESLIESKMEDGLDYKDISEIAIRFTTVTELAIDNGLIRQDKVPSAEEEKSKHGEFKLTSFGRYTKPEKEKEEPEKQQQEQEESFPIPLILISCLLTAIILYKRFVAPKQKGRNKK